MYSRILVLIRGTEIKLVDIILELRRAKKTMKGQWENVNNSCHTYYEMWYKNSQFSEVDHVEKTRT